MASADYTSHGSVAVITLNNPPVNALSVSVRKGLADGLEKAAQSSAISAVVLTGAGQTFCGGADVGEFGRPEMSAAPSLHDLCGMAENFAKPIVAALNGTTLGGGLELAMCCHYRIAA